MVDIMSKVFSAEEITIILGVYYFDDKKINDKFLKKLTDRINSLFSKNYSTQMLSYAISIFKNLDTRFIAQPIKPDDEDFIKTWKFYIDDDKIYSLKTIYSEFKKNVLVNRMLINCDDSEYLDKINSMIGGNTETIIIDEPKPLYGSSKEKEAQQTRNVTTALNALKAANYQCEFNNQHESFIRKGTDLKYTEGHHLVPLEFQKQFSVNLDVEANIVSLCSNCHNQLHYGKNADIILKKLYNERINRLKKCGIEISFEQLLKMYE